MNIEKNTINCLAEKVVNEYRLNGKIDWQIFSMDPIILAKMYGYKVVFENLGDDELLGMTVFNKTMVTLGFEDDFKDIFLDDKTIVVNSSLLSRTKGELNILVAKLFAHHMLQSVRPEDYVKKFGDVPVFIEKNSVCDSLECAVYSLATAILMPIGFLEIVFFKTFKTGYIPVLNSELHRDNYVRFCAIADLFGVTKRDLCVRLQKEGFLGEFQYCDFERIPISVGEEEDMTV